MNLRIDKEESGIYFVWNENSHTVNIYDLETDKEVDVQSIGSFAEDSATLEDFKNCVSDYGG